MTDDTDRSIALTRTSKARFRATNARGGTLDFGGGDGGDCPLVGRLLGAIAGCSVIDVDYLTGKRVEPTSFDVAARADKIRDELGNRLTDIRIAFDVSFPPGAD